MRRLILSLSLMLGACAADPAAGVAINEIQAQTDDWIELMNHTSAPIDLSSYQVTDGDEIPRHSHAIVFPQGTLLGPGEFLLIVANLGSMAMPGVQTTCLATGGPPTCFQASWGINRTLGESVFLLSPQGAIVNVDEYPPEAVATGQAWGRIPDGTGAFAATTPTPGAPNRSAL